MQCGCVVVLCVCACACVAERTREAVRICASYADMQHSVCLKCVGSCTLYMVCELYRPGTSQRCKYVRHTGFFLGESWHIVV